MQSRKIPLILLLIFGIFTTHAQDARLTAFAKKLAGRDRLEQMKASALADSLGIVKRIENGDGIVQLCRFTNGFPRFLTTNNLVAAATTSTSAVWPLGSAGLALTGSGITMGIWDGGSVRTDHQELTGRVTAYDLAYGITGHSTHVAGTMIATGVVGEAKGMAYQAGLLSYDWDNDNSEMATAAANGLQVSNHSYGYITGWYNNYRGDGKWVWFGDTTFSRVADVGFGAYDQTSWDWDNIASLAPEYLIVKSAGNDRFEGPVNQPVSHWIWKSNTWFLTSTIREKDGGTSGYDCIAWNGVAKNILTIGAVNDIPTGYQNPSQVVLASFSGTGPTDDGRIKPDLVANGTGLYSSYSTSTTAYAYSSGTSMATPNTSGSIGLLLEHQKNLTGSSHILSATLKGLLIHTADESGAAAGPDYTFGWGLLNTRKAALLMSENAGHGFNFNIRELTISQGETIRIPVYASGTEPLTATMVWTDLAPSVFTQYLNDPTPMLVNDLDLRIISHTNAITSPWKMDRDHPASAATRGDNIVDNVEKAEAGSSAAQLTWYVQITHKGTLSGGSQNFSLILTGIDMPPAATAWNGSAGEEWYNPANWSNGVPGAGTSVTIPGGISNYPDINSQAVCQNIAIAMGASLLDHGNLIVTGAATVQCELTGSSRAWHLISSPVASQAIDPGFTADPATSYDFFTWHEPAGSWVNFKNTTVSPTWNEANGTGAFVAGKGYLVEYSGISLIKQFQGNLNSGTVSYTLTKSSAGTYAAYNLAGNPYPSAIDWKATEGWTRDLLVASSGGYDMSIWNDADGNYGSFNSAGLSGSGTHGVTQYIQVGQGFMVKAAASGNLEMSDGIRVHAGQPFLKSNEEISNILRLKVSGNASAYSDEILIEFGHPIATGGAEKMFSFYETAPSLYTVKPAGNYSIDFRGDFGTDVIPVSFKAGAEGNYALTASQLESFTSSPAITLEDVKTGRAQNLMKNPTYSFTAAKSDDHARFFLHFGDAFSVNDPKKREPVNIYSSGNTVYIAAQTGMMLKGDVMVYNMIGQPVMRQPLSETALTSIKLSESSGYFLIRVITADDAYSGSVFIYNQ
jgi:hypothetical protein